MSNPTRTAQSERGQALLEGLQQGRGLYLGDNLEWMRVLRTLRPEGCIDLVYIDPPFNSKRDYVAVFKDAGKGDYSVQKQVFTDTWSNVGYKKEMEALRTEFGYETLYRFLTWIEDAYVRSLGMVSYLSTMALRIAYIHALLRETGSFYLHCDPTMSHYLKVVCDTVFGSKHFRREIVWKRSSSVGSPTSIGGVHDVILYYVRSKKTPYYTMYVPLSEEHKKNYNHIDERGHFMATHIEANKALQGGGSQYTYKDYTPARGWLVSEEKLRALDEEGRLYWTKHGKPLRKYYLDESKGRSIHDLWTDIGPIAPTSKERKGYPTQKPRALLERIIQASSREGDLVVDFFAGCGTTMNACEVLKRKWLVFDIQSMSLTLMREDLRAHHGQEQVVVGGLPRAAEQLKEMTKTYSRSALQEYIVEGKMGGICNVKGPDGGWDGGRYLDLQGQRILQLIEVKTGQIGLQDIERAMGVAERKGCAVVIVAFEDKISKGMRALAEGKGMYELSQGKHRHLTKVPRCNVLSVEELYEDKDPHAVLTATFFSRTEARKAVSPELGLDKV